jgi:hypothetical protein
VFLVRQSVNNLSAAPVTQDSEIFWIVLAQRLSLATTLVVLSDA